MPSRRTPLVLLPRHTTYSGATTFTSIGMDVSQFTKAVLNVWRSTGTGTFCLTLQESEDHETWTTCDGTEPDFDPGPTEELIEAELKKQFLRLKIDLAGVAPTFSCWAIGYLQPVGA